MAGGFVRVAGFDADGLQLTGPHGGNTGGVASIVGKEIVRDS